MQRAEEMRQGNAITHISLVSHARKETVFGEETELRDGQICLQNIYMENVPRSS